MTPHEHQQTGLRSPHGRLTDDHAEIELLLTEIGQGVDGGLELALLRDLWVRFAALVEAHFQMEENTLFRRADVRDEGDLLRLWADHNELREWIERMTTEVERRALRSDTVRSFQAKLRAHAAMEDRSAYAWASWDLRH